MDQQAIASTLHLVHFFVTQYTVPTESLEARSKILKLVYFYLPMYGTVVLLDSPSFRNMKTISLHLIHQYEKITYTICC